MNVYGGVPLHPVYMGVERELVIWDTTGEVSSIKCDAVIEVTMLTQSMRDVLGREYGPQRLSKLENALYVDHLFGRVFTAVKQLMGR